MAMGTGNREANTLPAMGREYKYRITVVGKLDTSWSSRLAGMAITIRGGEERQTITILEGKVSDQSALIGVINTLNDLQYPLLSVEFLEQNK